MNKKTISNLLIKMATSKFTYAISILLFGLLLFSCSPEHEAELCGIYKDKSCKEFCYFTYILNAELKLSFYTSKNTGESFPVRYEIFDSNMVVFKFTYYQPGDSMAWDTEDGEQLLFQIPSDEIDEFYIDASEFREYNVFYLAGVTGSYGVLKEDRGCIYLKKLSDRAWEVSVNLDYYLLDDEKWEKVQFTEVFIRE